MSLPICEISQSADWVSQSADCNRKSYNPRTVTQFVYACVFRTYRTSVPNLTVVGYPRVLLYCSQ